MTSSELNVRALIVGFLLGEAAVIATGAVQVNVSFPFVLLEHAFVGLGHAMGGAEPLTQSTVERLLTFGGSIGLWATVLWLAAVHAKKDHAGIEQHGIDPAKGLLDLVQRSDSRRSSCDPLEVARELVDVLAAVARQRSARVTVVGQKNLHVAIDSAVLYHVLATLLVDTLHATRSGGEVTVGVEPGCAPNYVTVAMCSSGGAESMTTPFLTPLDFRDGTSMRRAIAYAIIEDHHGFIEVGPSAELGLHVRVNLPRQQR